MATLRSNPPSSKRKASYRPVSGVGSTSPMRFYSPVSSHLSKRPRLKANFINKLAPEGLAQRPHKLFDTSETAVRMSGRSPVIVKRHQRTTSDYTSPMSSHNRKRSSGLPLTQLPTLSNLNRSVNPTPDFFSGLSAPHDWRSTKNSRSGSRQQSL
jgi:hypothetical protein